MIRLSYCGSYTALTGYGGGKHSHEFYQLEVIESGAYSIIGEDGETALHRGDAVLIPPGVEHDWGLAHNVRALTFRYTYGSTPPIGKAFVVKSLREDGWLFALPHRVYLSWRSADSQINGSSHSLFQGLIQILQAGGVQNPRLEMSEEWAQLLEELHDITHPPLEIEEMAQRVYLSPSHFRRLFVEHTGIAPGRFQREARLRRAAELIKYTDISMSQVAEQLGYCDLASFSKAFRKQHGTRPSKVRH